MNKGWDVQFGGRMRQFHDEHPPDGESVSIKVRVCGGCFHREHSPAAYGIIDKYLDDNEQTLSGVRFEEHESGPELLVWLALGTSAITLAKSVIDLVVAIIKARSDGARSGDRAGDPVELIVRKASTDGKVIEERIVRVHVHDEIDSKAIGESLNVAVKTLLGTASLGSEDESRPR
jgi:hypothetical protein